MYIFLYKTTQKQKTGKVATMMVKVMDINKMLEIILTNNTLYTRW
jgi:hypothetical protein